MPVNKEKDKLVLIARQKFNNNPGFFEGILDVIEEFCLVDFIQFHACLDYIIPFLKAYQIDGLAVKPGGELSKFIYPFKSDADIHLALYIIVNFLK